MFRFRFRAKNINGWSDFSPIQYITAAAVPVRPPAPEFVTATAATITLVLSPSTDSRGSDITAYELFRNGGGTSTTYTLISSYSTGSNTVVITSSDGITSG